jgi:hypothetical protein
MPSSEMLRRVALCKNRSVIRLLLTPYFVLISPIFVTLIMEALRSSETSVLARATQDLILEDSIHQSHRRENLKSYIALTHWDQ